MPNQNTLEVLINSRSDVSGLTNLEKAMLGVRSTIKGLDKDLTLFGSNIGSANDLLSGLGLSLPISPMQALGQATGLVVQGLRYTIAEAAAAQKILAQTEAVVASTGGAAGYSAEQISNLAASLADVSTVDDESIQQTANVLLTFTNIKGEQFDGAMRAIIDMSTALGTDLQSAAVQAGKALNDPVQGISALQRVGVSFSDEQKEVITTLVETGRVAEAQQLILEELNREFGGSAQAQLETYEGKLKSLNNKLGDLAETIGEDLLPVITWLVDGMTKAIDAADLLLNWNNKLDEAYAEQNNTLLTSNVTYAEYRERMLDAAQAAGIMSDINRNMLREFLDAPEVFRLNNWALAETAKHYNILTQAEFEAGQASLTAADQMARYRNELGLAAVAVSDLEQSFEPFAMTSEELDSIFNRDLAQQLTEVYNSAAERKAETNERIVDNERQTAEALVAIAKDAEAQRADVYASFMQQRISLDESYEERKRSLEGQIADEERKARIASVEAQIAELEERERKKGSLNKSEQMAVEALQRELVALQQSTQQSRLEQLQAELVAIEEEHARELAALERKEQQAYAVINSSEAEKTAAVKAESEKRMAQYQTELEAIEANVKRAYLDTWLPAIERIAGEHEGLRGIIDELYKSTGALNSQISSWLEQLPGQYMAVLGAFGMDPEAFRQLIQSTVTPPRIPGGQYGLDGVVPLGYSNDSYLVRASSGERVTITPPGHGAPASAYAGGAPISATLVYAPQYSTASKDEFEQNIRPMFERMLRDARRKRILA